MVPDKQSKKSGKRMKVEKEEFLTDGRKCATITMT